MKLIFSSQLKKEQPTTGKQKDHGRKASVVLGMNDSTIVWHLSHFPNNGNFHLRVQDCVK